MKRIIGFLLILLLAATIGTAFAQACPQVGEMWLRCDPQPNIAASEIRVDGIIYNGQACQDGPDLWLYDVTTLFANPGDSHSIEARLQDASGLWGDWNPIPLSARLPDVPGGFGVKRK